MPDCGRKPAPSAGVPRVRRRGTMRSHRREHGGIAATRDELDRWTGAGRHGRPHVGLGPFSDKLREVHG
jgi:hypothetical protein